MKVDFFLLNRKIYTFERYAISNLRRAFKDRGIETELFIIEDGTLIDYLHNIEKKPPNWTFSASNLFVHKQALCDVTKLPHFCWEHESLSNTLYHLKSPYGHLGFVDRNVPFERLVFLPHAYDHSFACEIEKNRDFDIVIFDELVDTEELDKNWKEIFDEKTGQKLKVVLQKCIENPKRAPLAILIENVFEGPTNYFLFFIEEYLKARRIRAMIESIPNRRVDVFGDHIGNNWLVRLKNPNVYLHTPLPYTEHFEVLKRSKVLLRDQLQTSNGSDEWLFAAFALGCAVLTNGSPYLHESFEGKLFCYKTENWAEMNEMLNELLDHPQKRKQRIEEVQKYLKDHTFETRAQFLLNYMK